MGPRNPLDLVGAALALLLAALGALQFRASGRFSAQAVPVTATVVSVEVPKRGLLDATSDAIATVEFEVDGTTQRATLAQPLARIGVDPGSAVGVRLPVRFDPTAPAQVHHGNETGREAAYVLFALAAGAVVAPRLLRRAQLSSGGG
ncbi:MAG: DUF3592 domain-containing protein [Planctomycetota bacterium]